MTVQPNTTRLPAESPYNTFIIFCNASVPEGVVAPKTLEWRRRVMMQTNEWQEIIDNGDTIQIETSGLNQSMTTSQLTVSETTPGDYQYQCWISITDLGNHYQDVNVSVIGKYVFDRRASTCIVRLCTYTLYSGPTAPVFTGLTASNTQHIRPTIQWTVPVIAYTPENYVVIYGTDMNTLDSLSETLYSGDNFTADNLTFSVELTGLRFTTEYHYQLVATNSFNSTSSDVLSFTTPDQSKCSVLY